MCALAGFGAAVGIAMAFFFGGFFIFPGPGMGSSDFTVDSEQFYGGLQ
jgi:hypothetical protein